MENSVLDSLKYISEYITDRYNYDVFNRQNGVDSIKKLKSLIDGELPDDFLELYSEIDGQKTDNIAGGPILGLKLLSINEIIEEIGIWTDLLRENYGTENIDNKYPDIVSTSYYKEGWIPLLYDGGGNFLAMDLNPESKGKRGQIINFGPDEYLRYVVFSSLNNMIEWQVKQMKDGSASIKADKDGDYLIVSFESASLNDEDINNFLQNTSLDKNLPFA